MDGLIFEFVGMVYVLVFDVGVVDEALDWVARHLRRLRQLHVQAQPLPPDNRQKRVECGKTGAHPITQGPALGRESLLVVAA